MKFFENKKDLLISFLLISILRKLNRKQIGKDTGG